MGQVDLVRLNMLLRRKGLGPTELANRAGVDPAAVTRIFRGSDPRGTTLAKLAEALGVSVDYLLGRTETFAISVEDASAEDALDSILKELYGYDHEQIEAVRRQLEALAPKRDFPFGDEQETTLEPALAP